MFLNRWDVTHCWIVRLDEAKHEVVKRIIYSVLQHEHKIFINDACNRICPKRNIFPLHRFGTSGLFHIRTNPELRIL
jgi:SET domain-containing protein